MWHGKVQPMIRDFKDKKKDIILQLARAHEQPRHSTALVQPPPTTPFAPPHPTADLRGFLLASKGTQETDACLGQVSKQIYPVYFGSKYPPEFLFAAFKKHLRLFVWFFPKPSTLPKPVLTPKVLSGFQAWRL